ncbi:MAG: DUF2007 domain-containing protein [Gammaproteobacteria bacterium]|nr:DUF2007 domain-containing protein [Gammaproteobacteria bacterium]
MKMLYQAGDRIEAQMLKDFLGSHHIRTVVQGEYLSGAAGELPAMAFPVLWVLDDRDVARGKQLINAYYEAESNVIEWSCPGCKELNEGQFHICWSCGAWREE